MKKILLLAASAMVLFASCNKTEIIYNNEPQEITMFSVNQNATKTPVADAVYPEGYDMNVAAFLAQSSTSPQGDYFEGTLFTKKGAYWAGATTSRYWPLTSSTINFLAVSQPKTAGNFTGTVTTTFTSPYAQNATTILEKNQVTNTKFNQFDLMYAVGKGNVADNNPPANVPMTFNHALSWIVFKVSGSTKVTIKQIALNGARYGGELTITNGAYDSATDGDDINQVTASWTNPETELDGVSVPNAAGTDLPGDMALTATPQEYGAGLLVLPNAVSGRSIDIQYTIDGGSPLNKTVFLTQPASWEMGKKYIYNLTINVNEILIDAEVKSWVETAGQDITIN